MDIYDDLIKATTSSTGTGAITLDSEAPTGFIHPDDSAIIESGDSALWLVIDNPNLATQWEVFRGIYTEGSPSTISRGAFLTSITGSRINFSAGTKIVRLVNPAEAFNIISETVDSNIETGGSSGAYTVQSRRNAPPVEGTTIRVKANHAAPSGGCTVSWNGASAVSLLDRHGAALGENAMLAGRMYTFLCDSTGAFRVLDAEATVSNAGLASAALVTAIAANTAALDGKMDDPGANGIVVRTGGDGASTAIPYATGSETLTFTFGTAGTLGVTYNSRSLTWTRIGDRIFVDFSMDFTLNAYTGASGNGLFGGLTVNAAADAAGSFRLFTGSGNDGPAFTANRTSAMPTIAEGSSTIVMFQQGGDNKTTAGMGTSSFLPSQRYQISGSISYKAAS